MIMLKLYAEKLTEIAKMSNFMSEFKKKVLIRTFFESQSNYCPFIWMFCSRSLNHKIDRLHKGFEDFLWRLFVWFRGDSWKNDSIPVHIRNLRTLAIEMWKISNNLSPFFTRDMMTEICVPYDTRSTTKIEEDESGSSRYTKNVTMRFQVPKLFHMD